jgi:hypothetical protein
MIANPPGSGESLKITRGVPSEDDIKKDDLTKDSILVVMCTCRGRELHKTIHYTSVCSLIMSASQ